MATERGGWRAVATVLAAVVLGIGVRAAVPARTVDLAVRGGLLVDGTGAKAVRKDLFADSGRISHVGFSWRRVRGRLELDASGLVVAPGFIDVHTHVERNLPQTLGRPFLAWSFLRQGVTSVVTGNCGTSLTSVTNLRRIMEEGGGQVNVATLVGHNSVREAVLKDDPNRSPTRRELFAMRYMVSRALADGALGLSTGLGYEPGIFSGTDEIAFVGGGLRVFGGVYATHVRNESYAGAEAIREAVEAANALGVPLQLSHLKTAGQSQWGEMGLRLAELARAEVPYAVDLYPYTASSTSIDPLLPSMYFDQPSSSRRAAFRSQANRATLKKGMREILQKNGWDDYAFVQVASFWSDRSRDGFRVPKLLDRLGDNGNAGAGFEAQADLLIDMALRGGAQMIYHEMSEEDVREAMLHPLAMFGSDAGVRYPDMDAKPHPRGMGTFPRVIAEYVREEEVLTLEEAIRKMTSLPAETLKLGPRGRLTKGHWADIVVFDLDGIQDEATYQEPLRPPSGIVHVFVNGQATMLDGSETRLFPGVFIPRGGE